MGAELSRDHEFMGIAIAQSQKSNDPSSKMGAAVHAECGGIVGLGFNGFPNGIAEDQRIQIREVKYDLIIHAEMRALVQAGDMARGATLYITAPPCIRCAVHIVEYRIRRVVSLAPSHELWGRWGGAIEKARNLLAEAGIEYVELGAE